MNEIEKVYNNIVKDVNSQLESIIKASKRDYDKFNQDFKIKYGISYDDYYDYMMKFYGEE